MEIDEDSERPPTTIEVLEPDLGDDEPVEVDLGKVT